MNKHETTYDDRAASALDRVWAATRPPDLSSRAFDRIWADVQAAVDRPVAIAFDAAKRSAATRRRIRIWGLIGLAQAASILAAIGVRSTFVDRPPPPVRVQAERSVVDHLKVDPDETLVIQIGDTGVDYRVLKTEESPALAFNVNVETGNSYEMLSQWETLSND